MCSPPDPSALALTQKPQVTDISAITHTAASNDVITPANRPLSSVASRSSRVGNLTRVGGAHPLSHHGEADCGRLLRALALLRHVECDAPSERCGRDAAAHTTAYLAATAAAEHR
jgi:hypothetical protein